MERIKEFFVTAKNWMLEEYLYRVKKIELPQHIERRMSHFQKKVERMMKRRGIALIAYNISDGKCSLSYVPERQWNEQKDVMENIMKEEGDKIETK